MRQRGGTSRGRRRPTAPVVATALVTAVVSLSAVVAVLLGIVALPGATSEDVVDAQAPAYGQETTVPTPVADSSSEPSPAATPTSSAAPTAAPERPNVVVVMVDDMRVDEVLFAPRVRRLVGEAGVTFENSFSPFPLCCPARASFLTGTYAHNHGVYWHEPPYGYGGFDDSRTLATSLQEAGYRTGFVGRYLNRYGLDTSKVSGEPSHTYVPNGWDDWRAAVDGGPGVHGSTYNYFDIALNVNGTVEDHHDRLYSTEVLGRNSAEMARRFAREDEPFFMYVNHVAPHHGGPAEPDDPSRVVDANGRGYSLATPARPDWVKGRFDEVIQRGLGMPRDGGASEADVSDKPTNISRVPEPTAAEREAVLEESRQRAEAIHVMDLEVGRLVRALQQSGEWEDTVFVFTSDNGYLLGEHRRLSGKVLPYEPSLRVPLLVAGPGIPAGERRYDPVTTIDLTATILDLADAEPPAEPDGTSRVATMAHGDQGWTTPVLTEAANTWGGPVAPRGFDRPRSLIGLRTPHYAYIRSRTGEHELYDLGKDPVQEQNVFGDPAYRNVLRQLDRLWWRMKECVGADCQQPLPPALAASPAESARATRAYWNGVEAVYGLPRGFVG